MLNGMLQMLSKILFKNGEPCGILSDSAAKNKSGEIKDLEQHYNISDHHYSEAGWRIKLETLRIWLIISWILLAPLPGVG